MILHGKQCYFLISFLVSAAFFFFLAIPHSLIFLTEEEKSFVLLRSKGRVGCLIIPGFSHCANFSRGEEEKCDFKKNVFILRNRVYFKNMLVCIWIKKLSSLKSHCYAFEP